MGYIVTMHYQIIYFLMVQTSSC